MTPRTARGVLFGVDAAALCVAVYAWLLISRVIEASSLALGPVAYENSYAFMLFVLIVWGRHPANLYARLSVVRNPRVERALLFVSFGIMMLVPIVLDMTVRGYLVDHGYDICNPSPWWQRDSAPTVWAIPDDCP